MLNNQNEFMKCWVSETKAISLSGWSAETTNRQAAALAACTATMQLSGMFFLQNFKNKFSSMLSLTSATSIPDAEYTSFKRKGKNTFSGFTATVVLKLLKTLKSFCTFGISVMEVWELCVPKINSKLHKYSPVTSLPSSSLFYNAYSLSVNTTARTNDARSAAPNNSNAINAIKHY